MNETGRKEELPTGSDLQKDERAISNVFVVAIDITHDLSLRAAEWALEHNTKKGDRLVLLGVLEDASHDPPKQKLLGGLQKCYDDSVGLLNAEPIVFNETNGRNMPNEATWKKSEFEQSITPFEASCSKKGVLLETRVAVGTAKLIVVEAVTILHARSLMLDRNLRLKEGKDLKFIQDKVSCRIYQMKNDFEANIIQEDDLATEGGFVSAPGSDEGSEAQATVISMEFEPGHFSTSSQSDSSTWWTIGDQDVVPHAERSCLPGCFPRAISYSSLLGLNRQTEISSQTGGVFQNAASSLGASMSQIEKYSRLTSSPSPPKSHKNVNASMSRSVSDSCFGNFGTHSLTENVKPISVQPLRRGSEALAVQKSLGVLNLSPSFPSSDYENSTTDDIPTRSEPSLLAENHELQQQTGPQKELKRINFQPIKCPSLNCSLISNSFSQGRSFLCSICKRKSPQFGSLPRRFSLAELQTATGNFCEANFLAEGGFGYVHKGVLNGQDIAVKQHKLASTQGYKEFRSEVEVLSCAQHRNLVMLLGCCDENGHQMLVYEYVCNKSLDWHLSCNSSKTLEWAARWKIALGTARALRYLHEECRAGCIVHRDMRPNNILLTCEFEPMVGDFGLARSHPEGEHAIETRIIGTFGYLSPEYAETGQVSWKADVYAFGVVLLELITGRKAIDLLRPSGQQSLTEWARPKLLNDAMFNLLLDHSLQTYKTNEVRSMMRAAYQCIKKDPLARPRMSQVLHFLESENKDWDEMPRQLMDLSFAEQYKVHESNAEIRFSLSSLSNESSASLSSLSNESSASHKSKAKKVKPKLSYGTML